MGGLLGFGGVGGVGASRGDCARADVVSSARARAYFRECSDVLSDYW